MSLFSKLSKNTDKTLYPWSQKKLSGSNSALPRAAHAATAVSSEAFIIYGGLHRPNTKKELFYIDANNLSANSINASGDIPTPRISPVMVAMNAHVLLYGGQPLSPDEEYDANFYLLNLHSKQWTRIQMEGNLPMERTRHSAVAHEGIMYMWGGQKEGTYLNDLFVFNSNTFNTVPRWEQLHYNNQGPSPRSGHISAFYENKLFIFGGTDGHHVFNDIWSFDLHTGLWTEIEANGLCPVARENCASAMVDDVIYIIGGKGENGVELNDLCAFKIKSRRWFRFQNMGPSPSPRHGLTMTAVRDKLYVLGGENDTAKLDDSSFIFILDSTKIKYPTDTPIQQQSFDSTTNHNNQHYDQSEEMNTQHHQQQPMGAQVPQQQYQQQQLRVNTPNSAHQHQQQQSSPIQPPQTPRLGNKNHMAHKEIDTSMNYSDNNQPSPTSSSSPSSLASPRHRSYYPEGQPQAVNQPPVRPPRHMSTVPEAALRRPRATSPLPQTEHDVANDIRRQYSSPSSSMENNSPLQMSVLSATDENNFLEPPQMIMSPSMSARTSPVAPPPRPPREGVGLNQRGIVPEHEDQRPKSQMPVRNQSNPHSPQPPTEDMLQQQQAHAQHQLAQQQAHAQQQLAQQQAQQQAQEIAQQQAQHMAQQKAQQLAQQQAQQHAQQQAHELAQQQAQQLAQQQAQQLAQQQAHLAQQQTQLAAQQAEHLAQQQARQLAEQQAQQEHQYVEPIPERSPSRQIASPQHPHTNSPSPVNRPRQQDAAIAATAAAHAAAMNAVNTSAAEERQNLLREINTRDMIISEMKKKENWWRTEVSLARKQRSNNGQSYDEGPDADEALLMDVDHLQEDKVKLFEQLVSVKSELRRVRGSILQQAQPMSEKVSQADRMRTAALQEAAYFKSKYLALKSRRQNDLEEIEQSRCDVLEKRLAAALTENEANSKMLQQLQKRSQHDQTARVSTEERAKEAQERAEEAQHAHQRALEELQTVYGRATKAEVQVRDNAVKIAELTQQLSDALLAQPIVKSQEVTEAQLKASQLEAANLKARNESAVLKQKLAESIDDIARLRTILNERDDALSEAKVHVEDYEIQLGMMREAMNQQQQQHQKNASVNGYAPTRAY